MCINDCFSVDFQPCVVSRQSLGRLPWDLAQISQRHTNRKHHKAVTILQVDTHSVTKYNTENTILRIYKLQRLTTNYVLRGIILQATWTVQGLFSLPGIDRASGTPACHIQNHCAIAIFYLSDFCEGEVSLVILGAAWNSITSSI